MADLTERVARALLDTRCIEDHANQRILREAANRREARLIAAAALAAVEATPGLEEALAAHGWEHIGVVDGNVWCATDDATIGKATSEGVIPDRVVYAHQAAVVRAWLRGEGT